MDDQRSREWAAEHLVYEVNTLEYATLEIAKGPVGSPENVLLESFIVHVRCLNDFLWRDRRPEHPRDVFAADFCEPGGWEEAREGLPQDALRKVRRRFGREVMHLTEDRIRGHGKDKEWACGDVYGEVANALSEFGGLALPERLGEEVGARLQDLTAEFERRLRLLRTAAGAVGGATGIVAGGKA